jgi:hypothetical protein
MPVERTRCEISMTKVRQSEELAVSCIRWATRTTQRSRRSDLRNDFAKRPKAGLAYRDYQILQSDSGSVLMAIVLVSVHWTSSTKLSFVILGSKFHTAPDVWSGAI